MSALDTAKDIIRIGSTVGLSKDVIDLLEKKSTLLAEQVATLVNENSHLKLENAKLRQQLQNLKPITHGLTDEDIGALRFMDTAGDIVYPRQVAAVLGITESRAVWLLDRLSGLERVWCRPILPHSYSITQKGRDVIHNPSA